MNPLWGESGLYSLASAGATEELRRVRYAHKRAVEGFTSVELLFFHGKLAFISLHPKAAIPLSEIQSTYGLDFAFWNLSRSERGTIYDFSHLMTPLKSEDTPTNIVPVSFPLRTFYVVASQDGNVFGAFAYADTTVQRGNVVELFLVSRDYVRPASPRPQQDDRPKTESILK
jgi:hypothetical protein